MSNKEQKAMKKSAKRPRVDETLPSDDSKNPDAVNSGNNGHGAFAAGPNRGDTLLLGTWDMGTV